jgi:glycosyltransferase involved in cell wall biosynthesis
MKKIALVNQRYGLEVNGGSEYYTRLIAEKLKNDYQVEILTSKALSYERWENYYEADVEEIHGITVRRFSVKHERNTLLMRVIGKLITAFHLNTKMLGKLWVKAQGPYVPDLIEYIKKNQKEYDAFIFVTYLYYPTVIGLPLVRDKAILVPTAHDEPYIYFRSHSELFHMPKAIIYLTDEEKMFVEKKFHNQQIPSTVAGVGVDIPASVSQDRFRQKYHIEGDYIIYTGRIDQSKGCDKMLEYFVEYHCNHNSIQLVLMGQSFMELPEHPAIHYLGFVSEEDKFDGVSGARALWLPSQFESLSISVLEAMSLSVPVLVNGACEVLKGHCVKSEGGLFYENVDECKAALDILVGNDEQRQVLGQKANEYIKSNYLWEYIMAKIRALIEQI